MSNHSASFAYRDRYLMSLAEVTSKTHITDTVFAAPVLLLPRAKTAAASSFCELLLKVLILVHLLADIVLLELFGRQPLPAKQRAFFVLELVQRHHQHSGV